VGSEYDLTRMDFRGNQTIYIHDREGQPPEVFADHTIPEREIDAYVRAAMIRRLIEREEDGEGEDLADGA
jgi:hypothetical protein